MSRRVYGEVHVSWRWLLAERPSKGQQNHTVGLYRVAATWKVRREGVRDGDRRSELLLQPEAEQVKDGQESAAALPADRLRSPTLRLCVTYSRKRGKSRRGLY